MSIYGSLKASSSPFSVIVDGTTRTMYPNSLVDPISDDADLLCTVSGLLPGNHRLIVRNNPTTYGAASMLSISSVHIFASDPYVAISWPLNVLF